MTLSSKPADHGADVREARATSLHELGWNPFFDEQLSAEDRAGGLLVRVMSVHRGMVTVAGEGVAESISSMVSLQRGPEDRPTVGDWLLLVPSDLAIRRILDRTSLFKRPAPGDERRIQLIAANVDTLFVVTSCGEDFNVARLERYLVLASEAGVQPILVVTKIDTVPNAHVTLDTARQIRKDLQVEPVNARDPASVARLADYCSVGKTVALVGSSGVGKSTLVNTLKGSDTIATQAPRESDGKGLHTTVVRQMYRIGSGRGEGGWLIDTPGMRELQMSKVAAGVAEVFDDVGSLTLECRFTNCLHNDEPGCAIREAVALGRLEPARLARWQKLADEDAENAGRSEGRRPPRGKARRKR